MRGYIEIIAGWDDAHSFAVMDWSESGDSGWCAGAFLSRAEAADFAVSYSKANDRHLPCAEIIPFRKAAA